MNIAYPLHDALYLNITNRCPNACQFCIRRSAQGVGYNLWLDREPTAAEVIAAIGDPSGYREVVFCGYGEPLTRPEVVVAVARWLTERGAAVRIDTNGLADLFLDYDILPQLQGIVAALSISLNAPDSQTYQRITQTSFGPAAYPALLDFIRRSRTYIPRVVVTAVDYPGIDLKRVSQMAAEWGVEFKIRQRLH